MKIKFYFIWFFIVQTGDSEVYTPPDKAVIASLAFHPTDHVLLIATSNKLFFWSWDQPKPFACVETASAEEKVRYWPNDTDQWKDDGHS